MLARLVAGAGIWGGAACHLLIYMQLVELHAGKFKIDTENYGFC